MKSLNDALRMAAMLTAKSTLEHVVYPSGRGYGIQQKSIFPGKNPLAVLKKVSDKKVTAYENNGKEIKSFDISKQKKVEVPTNAKPSKGSKESKKSSEVQED